MATTINDLRSLSDPLLPFMFDVQIAEMKGDSGVGSEEFNFRCMSTSKPGMTIDPIEVQLHGHTLRYSGGIAYDGSWTTEVQEGLNANVRDRLYKWMRYMHNPETSLMRNKVDYQTTALVLQYDNDPNNIVETTQLIGVWPSAIESIALSGSDKSAMMLSITWTYDYWNKL